MQISRAQTWWLSFCESRKEKRVMMHLMILCLDWRDTQDVQIVIWGARMNFCNQTHWLKGNMWEEFSLMPVSNLCQAHLKTTRLVDQSVPKQHEQRSEHMSRNTHKHLTEMPKSKWVECQRKPFDLNNFIFPVFLMITRQIVPQSGCCYTRWFSLTSVCFFFKDLEKALLKTLSLWWECVWLKGSSLLKS